MQQYQPELRQDICPLCGYARVSDYAKDGLRSYLQCKECRLVFVAQQFHLSSEDERAVYDLHRNSPDDPGYRQFLSRLADPLLERLAPNSCGLDFGSGPEPTLSVILAEQGHQMSVYDPYYAPNQQALADRYDFITSTEVVEHLAAPGQELNRLWALLKPGGWLGIMTKLVVNRTAFGSWHYKNDPTHISFFSMQTFQYLAQRWETHAELFGKDVILMNKTTRSRVRPALMH